MNVRPGEEVVIDRDGAHRTRAAYPLPSEAHSAADLLRPLAADNARLSRQVAELEADVAAMTEALQERGRMPR